jgi:hypothetical protein
MNLICNEWLCAFLLRFYRVSGICLDLLVLGSVSSLEWAEPIRDLREGGGRGASLLGSFELTIIGILAWNLYARPFFFLPEHYGVVSKTL